MYLPSRSFAVTILTCVVMICVRCPQHLVNAKKAFIRFLSYEYRVSLNTIKASVESTQAVTEENTPQLSKIQHHLNGTKSACLVACSLLDNAMFFIEMEDRNATINKSHYDMAELLHLALMPMQQKVGVIV